MPRRPAGAEHGSDSAMRVAEAALNEQFGDGVEVVFVGDDEGYRRWLAEQPFHRRTDEVEGASSQPPQTLGTVKKIAEGLSVHRHWTPRPHEWLPEQRKYHVVACAHCEELFILGSGVRGIEGTSTWSGRCWSNTCRGERAPKTMEDIVHKDTVEYPPPTPPGTWGRKGVQTPEGGQG